MTCPRPVGNMRRASSSKYFFICGFNHIKSNIEALWRATGWYKRQHLSEESPAKPFRVCVRLRHDADAGCHWEMEREAFLHPISRLLLTAIVPPLNRFIYPQILT
ncbi:hypothetical protein TNCV_334421 [Trichonephila clavipes]|nr:hypothetical protein TNCV_334421 [Trichonephila clavipes]